MRKKAAIGIDFGTDSVKIVALESVPGEASPRILGVGAAQAKGMRKGCVTEPNETAKALKEALETFEKASGIKNLEAFAALGGVGLGSQKSKGLVAVSKADGEITREDLRRAQQAGETNLNRLQNKEILHKIPTLYKIDNEMLTRDPLGLVGNKLESEMLFITSFTQSVKNTLKALETADIDVEELVANPIAAAHIALGKRDKEFGAMVLDLGCATTSLAIFEEGLPYSLEILSIGSGHITQDIAMGLRITLEEAEKIKTNYGAVGQEAEARSGKKGEELIYGNYSKKKLAEIIEARLSDIFELVEKHLKKVERAGLLPAGIVIIGGGANLPGIESFAKEYLKLNARVAEPSNLGGFKDKVKNPAWCVAVGTAILALERQSLKSSIFRGDSAFFRWLRVFLP